MGRGVLVPQHNHNTAMRGKTADLFSRLVAVVVLHLFLAPSAYSRESVGRNPNPNQHGSRFTPCDTSRTSHMRCDGNA
ncbi:hypothetical protein BaRGS_00012832 [Batillaria attramentaria]|uniref:Uncharacterized protein n=1 Tax=Batillaria attramentaria TaxID=370345 RepID=A0ABD0L8Q1_9CAEN